jgi:hypothetical protein
MVQARLCPLRAPAQRAQAAYVAEHSLRNDYRSISDYIYAIQHNKYRYNGVSYILRPLAIQISRANES